MSIMVLLLFSSAFQGGIAPLVGSIAPSVIVEKDNTPIGLDDSRGKYVILSFWSSSDAESRIRCNEVTALVKSLYETDSQKEEQVRVMAVNFDRSERLFNEIVRRDNMDDASQFYVSGNSATMIKRAYGLDKGLKTFVIDPVGRIVAVNPDKEELSDLLKI